MSMTEESAAPYKYDRFKLLDESAIEYGHLAKTGGQGISAAVAAKEEGATPTPTPFYITTAINYANGAPHIGHAYEAATSDVIARHQRLISQPENHPVYFVTGSDEHGQKIAEQAVKEGKEAPIEICDKYVAGFQVLNQRLRVTNDDYVRTTSDRHKRTAKELWKRCHQAGDIYLDTYQGWYNVREETFVTETEAQQNDYKDPVSGLPYRKVEEESYFFKMSKYQERLIHYIEVDNPTFIQPNSHKNLILQRLKSDELRDLSISRTTFDWGIPVPEGFSDNHVMYVWLDALTNYLTGVDGLGTNGDNSNADLKHFWPASVHIIGKDILWFHTVIWPCLLMSAGVPLPKAVFAHGFVNDKEGKKMSKSMGNVVDPHDMLDKFEVDTLRWYLCKEAPYGGELSFSEDNMKEMHNSDLCATIGNLVHRATNLACKKYCDGVVPDVPAPDELPISNLGEVIDSYNAKMNAFELQGGCSIAAKAFRDINGFLQDQAPWHIKDNLEKQKIIVRATLEAVYAAAHLLLPFLPTGAAKIFAKLHTEPVPLDELGRECRNLKVGTPIDIGDILYAEIGKEDKNDAKTAAKETHAEAQRRKKEAKAAAIAKSKASQGALDNQPEFTKMEIRVGHIVKVWNHVSADKLYCEEIDVGEERGPREIASGLRDFYSLEEMQGRKVLVVCNLKATKLVGFMSNGMVLAAKSEDGSKVELIEAPADAPIGERVFIDGLTGEPVSSTQVKKKKVWEMVSADLKTGEGGVATWKGKEIKTSAGVCKVASLVGVPIS